MSYPRYSDLTPADMTADWKPGITQQEYTDAKRARTEMMNTFGSAQPYKGTSSVSRAASKTEHRIKAGKPTIGKKPNYSRRPVSKAA